MTEKQLKQAKNQLPQGERFDRAHSAYEGGIRLISKKADSTETRYKVIFNADGNVSLERFLRRARPCGKKEASRFTTAFFITG